MAEEECRMDEVEQVAARQQMRQQKCQQRRQGQRRMHWRKLGKRDVREMR